MNTLQDYAELVSLGMTIPTVVLAIAVVHLWLPSAKEAWKQESKSGHDWFIMGVVAGFCGSALDNIYWFLPWTAAFLDHAAFVDLTNLGVFFNIFFRQGLGIVAAFCHLRAAELSVWPKLKFLNSVLVSSYLLGIAYAIILVIGHGN
jgi:hypothetical protein